MRITSVTHRQEEPAATWTINHQLGYNPNVGVSVYENSVLTVILAQDVSFPTVGQVVVKFSSPRTGEVRLA